MSETEGALLLRWGQTSDFLSARMLLVACAATHGSHMAWGMSHTHAEGYHSRPDGLLHGWSACVATHRPLHVDQQSPVAGMVTSRASTCQSACSCFMHGDTSSFCRQIAYQMIVTTFWCHATRHLKLLGSFACFGHSGKFLTRDQSQIFFCSCSDMMNIFSKVEMNSDLEGYISWALASSKNLIILKLGLLPNFGFSRRASISSCLLPVLLNSHPAFMSPK